MVILGLKWVDGNGGIVGGGVSFSKCLMCLVVVGCVCNQEGFGLFYLGSSQVCQEWFICLILVSVEVSLCGLLVNLVVSWLVLNLCILDKFN